MLLNETVTVSLAGNSTTGLSVSLAPAYSLKNAQAGDYLHDTYVINPSTTATSIDLGLIATAHHLFAVCDQKVTLTLHQAGSDRLVDIGTATGGGAMLLDGDFTALKVANANTGLAANLTLFITGDRVVNSGSSGVFLSQP